MGTKSKHLRYREAGEKANEFNLEKYGTPHHTLFSSDKVLTIHKRMTMMDEKETPVYYAETKVWTMHDRTTVYNADKKKICTFTRKFFSFHERHFLNFEDGKKIQLSSEIWHIYKDICNIKDLEWRIEGNVFQLNFALIDKENKPLAVASYKMVSLHNKFALDIYQPEKEEQIVAVLFCIQHMLQDRAITYASVAASMPH